MQVAEFFKVRKKEQTVSGEFSWEVEVVVEGRIPTSLSLAEITSLVGVPSELATFRSWESPLEDPGKKGAIHIVSFRFHLPQKWKWLIAQWTEAFAHVGANMAVMQEMMQLTTEEVGDHQGPDLLGMELILSMDCIDKLQATLEVVANSLRRMKLVL